MAPVESRDQGWQFETAVRTLIQEASSEPLVGQKAVAHVILNRLKSGRWGHCYATVCLWPLQFSGWNTEDGNRLRVAAMEDDDPLLDLFRHVLGEAEQETDFTHGATHYYAPKAMPLINGVHAVPAWSKKGIFCGGWGSQLFFKGL